MKKILFASAASLMAFISIQAQSTDAIAMNDTRPAKEERKEIRKEKEKKALHLKNSRAMI